MSFLIFYSTDWKPADAKIINEIPQIHIELAANNSSKKLFFSHVAIRKVSRVRLWAPGAFPTHPFSAEFTHHQNIPYNCISNEFYYW